MFKYMKNEVVVDTVKGIAHLILAVVITMAMV